MAILNELPFEDRKAGQSESSLTSPKSDVKSALEKEAQKNNSEISKVNEKVEENERNMESVLEKLWENLVNLPIKNKIQTSMNLISDLKDNMDSYEQKVKDNKSHLIKRLKNRRYNPPQRELLGTEENDVRSFKREGKNIENDIDYGRTSYDQSKHQNKFVEEPKIYGSKKNNYVYAYKSFAKGQTGAVVEPGDIKEAQKEGYNLGQVEGGHGWDRKYNIYNNDKGMSSIQYESLLNEWRVNRFSRDGDPSETEFKLYESLLPGVARLPINFYYKLPLELLLEQNLLLPSTGGFAQDRAAQIDGKNKTLYGFFTKSADIQKSWDDIYQRNRNGGNEPDRGTDSTFPEGTISRQDIRELQEPRHGKNGLPIPNTNVINYSDDAKYNTYTTRHRGFYSNITGNVMELNSLNKRAAGESANSDVGGGALLPSIEQVPHEKVQSVESENAAAGQYFPFLFETVNRSLDPQTGGKTSEIYEQFAYFQATLSQLSEQYSPEWASSHFMGRTEDTYTYVKGSRAIDIRFIVFANSARELQNVYERVNWLAQQTYPLYDINPAKQRGGPIIRITIGDLLKQVAGFIRNVSFSWDFLGTNKWEIERGMRMPMACEVSMSFQVIHNYMPDRDTNFYEGLTDKMLKGGNYNTASTGFQNDNGNLALERRAWSSETNLIPTKPTNNSVDEQYVTMIARKSLRNRTGQDLTFEVGGQQRTYAPGESFSFADLARLQRGPTTVQTGEGAFAVMEDQTAPSPPAVEPDFAGDLPEHKKPNTVQKAF